MASLASIPDQIRRIILLFASLLVFVTLFVSVSEKLPLGEAFERAVRVILLETISEQPTMVEVVIISIGVIMLWFSVWTMLDLLIEGKIEGYFKEVKLMARIGGLKGHVIICGAGRVGSQIAKRLSESGKKFVLIEMDEKVAVSMREKGYEVLTKNCLEEQTLKSVGIEKATALAAVLGQTEKNLYLALVAKELNPKIRVYARADDDKIAKKLKIVGVDYVVTPETAGANAITDQIMK